MSELSRRGRPKKNDHKLEESLRAQFNAYKRLVGLAGKQKELLESKEFSEGELLRIVGLRDEVREDIDKLNKLTAVLLQETSQWSEETTRLVAEIRKLINEVVKIDKENGKLLQIYLGELADDSKKLRQGREVLHSYKQYLDLPRAIDHKS